MTGRVPVASPAAARFAVVSNRVNPEVATAERACEHCGQSFMPRRSDARFHTDACRTAASRAKRAEPNRTRVTASRAATVSVSHAGTALTWDPPSEPRRPHVTVERCPDCGGLLTSGRRGTWRFCPECRTPAVPPGVTSQHDQVTAQRHVLTAAERDQRDLLLAIRRDQLLARLRVAGLPAGSAVAELIAGKIRDAISDHRLAEVSDLLDSALAASGRQAAIEGDVVDGEVISDTDDDQDDDDETYVMVNGRPVLAEWTSDGRLVPAVPAPAPARPAAPRALTAVPSPLSWADALSALGWRLHLTPGGCQVITSDGGLCGDTENPYQITDRYGRAAWICWKHKEPLTMMMKNLRRLA